MRDGYLVYDLWAHWTFGDPVDQRMAAFRDFARVEVLTPLRKAVLTSKDQNVPTRRSIGGHT